MGAATPGPCSLRTCCARGRGRAPSWCQPHREGRTEGSRDPRLRGDSRAGGWGWRRVGEGGELSCPGPSLAAAVGGALLGCPGGRGAPHCLSSLLPLEGSRECSIPQHPTSLHCPLSWTDGRPPPARLQMGPWAHPRLGTHEGSRVASPCSVGSTVQCGWFPVEGKSGGRGAGGGPRRADRAGEAADPCRAALPRPTPWVRKQTRGSACRPPSQSGALRKGKGCTRPIRAGVPE